MNDVLARLHRVDYRGRRARRLRQARQLLRAPDRRAGPSSTRPPRPTTSRRWKAQSPGCPRTSRRATRPHRARRLPAREPDLPSDRAAHDRGARLGALDARPSARRPRLQLHAATTEQPDAKATLGHRLQAARHPDRAGLSSPPTAAAPARPDIANWKFYLAFSLFRLASIAQGVYKRGLDGNASSETAKQYGNRARVLADLAWSLVKNGA